VHAVGKVRSSLYQAAADAGIPSSAMAEIIAAMSYDVDFQRDIQPGNKIEVLMNRKVTSSGRAVSFSNARYAKLSLNGRDLEIFRFADANGTSGWFDAKGNSVKKSLLKTPISAARISSGFGMRKHPVLGYSKMHRGVDFAASTGTPIFAAGDGVVTFRGWSNGYGNFVQIKHNGTYSTAYGHISRFAPSLRQGGAVKQGQIIAYVGATGMATGPHLHFEVRQNGAQVNPTAQRFNTSQTLAGAQMQKFNAQKASLAHEIAALETSSKITTAAR
jgi:murein DD-endopeptidase MepM/ murein hydrolase activator NlpD